MDFCPNCGSRLVNKPKNKTSLVCQKCGYQSESSDVKFPYDKLNHEKRPVSGLVILDKKAQSLRVFPIVNMLCPRCGAKTAEVWSMSFGSENNSQATFVKCVSCGYTKREID